MAAELGKVDEGQEDTVEVGNSVEMVDSREADTRESELTGGAGAPEEEEEVLEDRLEDLESPGARI